MRYLNATKRSKDTVNELFPVFDNQKMEGLSPYKVIWSYKLIIPATFKKEFSDI